MSNTTISLPKTIDVETGTRTTKLDIKAGDMLNWATFGESSKMLMTQTLSSYLIRDNASLEQIVPFTMGTT